MVGARRVLLLGILAALALAAPARAAFIAAKTIDSATTPVTYGGISIASDGTGAVTYLKTVGGQVQVWVATLQNGGWSLGQRVDTGSGDEGDARVAAGPGGRVVVTYLTAGTEKLDAVIQASTGSGFSAPTEVRDSGGGFVIQDDATVAMGPTGAAYAVWCEGVAGAEHVLASRLVGATWTPVAGQLDTGVHTACGTGNGPDVAIGVDGSGNAVAMWDEQDTTSHAYARRLLGTTQGPLMDLRVPSLFGHAVQDDGDMLQIGVAADGSAWTVHRALYAYTLNKTRSVGLYIPAGSNTPSGPSVLDGWDLNNPPDGAEHPFVAVNSSGHGLWAANSTMSVDEWAGSLSGSTAGPANRIDAPGQSALIVDSPQTAIGDGGLGAVGWVNTKVFARAWNGSSFGGPVQISNDSLGSILRWTDFLHHTSADSTGDVVFGFGQTDGTNNRVVVAALVQPPTAPGTTALVQHAQRPKLTWTASKELYGGISGYRVFVDRKQLGATFGTSFTPSKNLSPGNHTWQVVAVDRFGQTTSSAARQLVIQTLTSKQLKADMPSKLKAVKGKVVVASVKCLPVCGTVTVSGAYHIKIKVKNKKGKKVTKTISIPIGSKTFKVLTGKKVTKLFFFLNNKGKNKLGHGKLTVFITLAVKEQKVSATKQATLRWANK